MGLFNARSANGNNVSIVTTFTRCFAALLPDRQLSGMQQCSIWLARPSALGRQRSLALIRIVFLRGGRLSDLSFVKNFLGRLPGNPGMARDTLG